MRSLFRREPRQPEPPVSAAAVAAGLRAFAADLDAGDTDALDCLTGQGELPLLPEDWADYPNSLGRRARIAYFGKTGPGDIPAADHDRLLRELACPTTHTVDGAITRPQHGRAHSNVHQLR